MNEAPIRVQPSVGRWLRFSGWLGRVWRWLLAALRGPEPMPEPSPPPPPPPPGQLRERRRLRKPLVVPADGYIFSFNVQATFLWTSQGLTREVLNSLVDQLMPYAVRELMAIAASHGRTFPPHRAHDFEVTLQNLLKERGVRTYERDGLEITCRPYAWVELEDRVKEAVQPYWEQLIKLDCEHDVHMKRAEYADRLSKQWMAVLGDLVSSPLADGAAEMTEQELAAVVRKIMAEKKAAAERLNSLIEERMRDGDTYMQEQQFETLRKRLEEDAAFSYATGPRTNGAANGSTRQTG